MRMTRAYLEGYVEGRTNPAIKQNPHTRSQEINDFEKGYRRGRLLTHFYAGTTPPDPNDAAELLQLRRDLGERV